MTTPTFPLSSAQREIWFDQMLHPDMPLYNVGGYLHIPGVVNVDLFAQAVQLLVQKHDALRTVLLETSDEDGLPLQTFAPLLLAVDVGFKDFASAQKSFSEAVVWMQARLEEPFALTQPPLFRCDLLKLADDDYYCLLQYHHLITDGWGLALVARSLADIYSALVAGTAPVLDSPSYAEFIRNDRSYVESPAFQRDCDFWLAQYPSAPDHLLARNGASRSSDSSVSGIGVSTCQELMMSRTLYQRLECVAQQYQATVFQVLLGVLYVYFARTSQQSTFAVGLPVLNRANAKFKQTAGLFVGVSPVLLRSDMNASFAELLQIINTTLKAVYRHQRFPLSEIQRLVSTQPDAGTLFEVNLSFQKLDYDLSFAGIPARKTLLWSRWEQSPLVVHVQDFLGHESVKLDFVYNHAYFNAGDIARLQISFMTLLEAVVEQATIPLRDLPIMSHDDRQQLAQWSGQDAEWVDAADCLISQQFAAQTERIPNAVAVVDAATGQQLTYRELNTRANQLAHYLRTQGIGADMPVGLCVERSADMLVGLLGILKAGAVYLPIDPTYPAERIHFMLEQAQVRLVLSQQAVLERVFTPQVLPADTALFALDSQWFALLQQPLDNPPLASAAEQLAYLIYTSGSTGQPKGVMVEQGALASHTRTMQQQFGLGANDRVLQFASMSFDVALEQILPALISGARVVIAQPHWSLDEFTTHLQAQQVTVCDLPPTYLHQVLAHWQTQQWQALPASLRLMIVGNDVVPPETVALWREIGRGIRLLNAYGPTEATITATCHELDAKAISTGKVPIGRPLPGKTAYVLDTALQPLPIGVPGELYLGGSGVARGYWQRDDLTAERFLAHPFGAGRLYRTGDLARWLPDGTLEFIGRVDHQVKLRGFRIELGEIETVLNQHPDVHEAAVIVREDQPGQKRLVAYWTAKPSADVSSADIMQHLQAALPAYMVPAVCVLLEVMPQTANGKINRKALPVPAEAEAANDTQYAAPTQPVEQQLADIWASVLGRESVGIHDNFFGLGGDSILSLQVVSRARQQGLLFQPKQLFQYQTIAKLASVVEQLASTTPLNTQGQVSGKVELTPVQHWFFDQDFAEAHHHNLAFRAEVDAGLAPETFTHAWQQVTLHHDALRSRFVQQDGQWQQRCTAEVGELTLAVIDLAGLPPEEQQARWEQECCRLQASLNLATGELQRMVLFRLGAQQPARLFWCIHHLVVDGVSWRVLLEDLQTACSQLQQGQAVKLPAKTTAFQTWAAWLVQDAVPYVQAERAHWQEVCANPTATLSADYPANITANTVASQAHIVRQLSVADTRSLLQDAHQAYHTQVNDLLLTALLQAYQQRTGQSRLRLDLEGHGREVLDTPAGGVAVPAFDLSRTVGWFTSIYPVALTLQGNDTANAIKAVKEQLRAIPNRGMGYGILRYLGKADELAGQAELCFNYLGQFDTSAADTAVLRHAMLDMATQPHSPQQQRPYALEINCLVVDGQLQVDCAYSTALHKPATVEAFAGAFMTALQAVLAHCRDPQAGGYTSSDFAQAKLKQNQLDQLLNRIKVNKRK